MKFSPAKSKAMWYYTTKPDEVITLSDQRLPWSPNEKYLGVELDSKMNFTPQSIRVGVKYSTCTWYLYLSTYLSVLDVLEYLVYGNAKVLVLVLVLDQKVLGTYK